jgi:hypothetical protein
MMLRIDHTMAAILQEVRAMRAQITSLADRVRKLEDARQ